jgi:Asp-tRNA(Asn)/Glu-tRNA(Gln) amidotransferase A subunit family amidase
MVALFELGAKRAADAVRNGEQTAEALAEALLARCAAASPLNAFISLEADRLRAAARAADQRRRRGERLGPLHGVPLALKDNIDTADFPTTGGTPALAAHRPKRNAPIVQHLLDAGAIVLGKTNLQGASLWSDQQQRGIWSGVQSVRSHAHPGRLERRQRRRGRSAPHPGRARHGHRRIHTRACRALRDHEHAPDHLALVTSRHHSAFAYP